MQAFETLDIIGEPEWIDNELSGRGHDIGSVVILTNVNTDEIVLHTYTSFL